MAPKPSVTTSTIQTKRLLKSLHSSVEMPIAIRISTPPMVGVPDFTKCVCGPLVRTACPTFKRASMRITAGPAIRPIASAVMVANTARKVMKLNTRNGPILS